MYLHFLIQITEKCRRRASLYKFLFLFRFGCTRICCSGLRVWEKRWSWFYILCTFNGRKRHGVSGSLENIIRERVCLVFRSGDGILTYIWRFYSVPPDRCRYNVAVTSGNCSSRMFSVRQYRGYLWRAPLPHADIAECISVDLWGKWISGGRS